MTLEVADRRLYRFDQEFDLPLLDPDRVEAIVWHHSATKARATPRAIARYHERVRKWRAVAYHALITERGEVFQGRPLMYKGAHAHDETSGRGMNGKSFGVCLIGTFKPGELPPWRQLAAAIAVAFELREIIGRDLENIGHDEAMARVGVPGHTECPGGVWPRWISSRMPMREPPGTRPLLD